MNKSRSTGRRSLGRPGVGWAAALAIFSIAPVWAAPAPVPRGGGARPAGPASAVDGIRVQGNAQTAADFIRRTAELAPGDAWTAERAAEARRLLMNTHLFQDVTVRPLGGAGPRGAGGVQIDVKERWSLGIYPNLTKDGDRFTYGLGVEETNLSGEGRRLGARAWGGDNGDGGEAWFSDPWLFGQNLFVNTSVSGGRWFDRYYDVDGSLLAENEISYVGGSVDAGVRLDSRCRVWGGMYVRDEDLTQLRGDIPTETGRFDVLRLGAVYDATTYEISRVDGWLAWTEMDQGTDMLGGDFRFRKLGLGGAWYRTPWYNHLLFARAEAWHGTLLPFREFFSLGGQDSLRGYLVGEFRGSRQIDGSVEYQVPFWYPQPAGYHVVVAAAAFLDWGLLWSEGEGVSLGDTLVGIGVGLRVSTLEIPFAGLRLDLGYGVETRSWEGYFSFGPAF